MSGGKGEIDASIASIRSNAAKRRSFSCTTKIALRKLGNVVYENAVPPSMIITLIKNAWTRSRRDVKQKRWTCVKYSRKNHAMCCPVGRASMHFVISPMRIIRWIFHETARCNFAVSVFLAFVPRRVLLFPIRGEWNHATGFKTQKRES